MILSALLSVSLILSLLYHLELINLIYWIFNFYVWILTFLKVFPVMIVTLKNKILFFYHISYMWCVFPLSTKGHNKCLDAFFGSFSCIWVGVPSPFMHPPLLFCLFVSVLYVRDFPQMFDDSNYPFIFWDEVLKKLSGWHHCRVIHLLVLDISNCSRAIQVVFLLVCLLLLFFRTL